MEGDNQLWNPHQFVPPQSQSCVVRGPLYPPGELPPSALNQPYQNFPTQFSFPPPPLPSHLSPSALTLQSSNTQLDSVISSPEIRAINCETDDKKWLTDWLAKHDIHHSVKRASSTGDTKLVDIRDILIQCLSVIKQLRGHHQQLSACSDFSDESDWDTSMATVELKKADLAHLLAKLRSLDVNSVKRKLSKRAKKRARLQRRGAKRREDQEAIEARRKTLHQRADSWLAEMRLTVEREHREEELRREADAVLGEVTRKQIEARRQLSLLDALIKLRGARAQRAAAHSSAQDAEADRSAKKFDTVIERLRKLWKTQLKEYTTEERGLRVMLQESAEQKSDARCQRAKAIVDQWKKAIFGENGAGSPGKQNIDQLIAIRREWDKFVVPAGFVAPVASSIPVGWVLPHGPTNDSWRRYCVAYDKSD